MTTISGGMGVVVLVFKTDCEKFSVGVVAFDWWLWKMSWFVGF